MSAPLSYECYNNQTALYSSSATDLADALKGAQKIVRGFDRGRISDCLINTYWDPYDDEWVVTVCLAY